ncbi:MAG: YkgJ family cysteine cluster protein [Crocinitomicaceae bacterium]|nr:YkgJ family cysteine cluster protein [Crocinitomicaceae bacterium]
MKKILHLSDELPLTCSRKGTCCFGNQVLVNPWELAAIAHEKNISTRDFRDQFCDLHGTRLLFDGVVGFNNQKSCSQYIENKGCSVHNGRPLACRLFPIGRLIQENNSSYFYEGNLFPCLNGCPEVKNLPYLRVDDYIKGQETHNHEQAQDAYLEIMQNCADIAFILLLETELATSGDVITLQTWRKMGTLSPIEIAAYLSQEWIDLYTIPMISFIEHSPASFAQQHFELIQKTIQYQLEESLSVNQIRTKAIELMALALFAAHSIGASTKNLIDLWVETAKQNGAKE